MGRIQIPDPVTVDFETHAIRNRPHYPPVPVGVSIMYPGERKSRYYAWGHPTENNCTHAQGMAAVRKAWASKTPLLFQNGKFDVDVAEVHCGVKRLDWSMYHDSMFLIFLYDPHAPTYSLKPSADRILGMPPEEQDAVRDWVLTHKREIEAEEGPFTPKQWGMHICKAPGKLVGAYANGDVIRTAKLFKKLFPLIEASGQMQAYDRERELMPILLNNERAGMRVDMAALSSDVEQYRGCLSKADDWLRKRLKSPTLNINSDADMASALKSAGVVTNFVQTATGRDSVSKRNLTADLFNDQRVFQVFGYRNRLTTCLTMFMEPWYALGQSTGTIHTTWNQVRQSRSGGGTNGARTGRPSTSNPNFLNLSKNWYDKGDGYAHPKHLKALLELPSVRRYILPDEGGVFCHRDYSQQELRLLAHFEDHTLLEAYNAEPKMDIHAFVADAVTKTLGLKIERRQAKVVNFGLLYGMGVGKLAVDLNTDVQHARQIKAAQLSALPGLRQLQRDIEDVAKSGEPVRTWGGRTYYPEEPKVINGRLVNFVYKLLNYLIQGSAADFTKQAIIRYDAARTDSRFMVTVYDEINISAPKGSVKREMSALRESMEGITIDVPMLTDGKSGPNWGDIKAYEEK